MSVQPFAETPEPPYVAVIFTSTRTDGDHGYAAMAASGVATVERDYSLASSLMAEERSEHP